jgi:formylglycine-generating enzyme required for sulfatase activity
MGDPRRGTGLDEQRLPDIAWIDIPHGEVTLETDPAKTFPVDAFRIAKYPVTWAQYRVFLNAQDGYHDPRWWIDLHQRQEPGREQWAFANYPVIIVSWYDAVAFCRWLSSRRGLEGISSIRLPTEWEWQWVAQSGNERREYPWGEWHPSRANTRDGGIGRTIAVGMYPLGEPDAWAVLDLAGNVLEWCLNEYHVPENISIGNGGIRVLRGGSWNDPPADCGVAHRDGRGGPAFRLIYYGFRVCCSAPID